MSSLSATLGSLTQQIVTYMGMSTVVLGLLGGLLNIVVFTSLKTFRQNSCAFFLTLMSAVNMGQLLTGQLTRVLITGFGVDLTKASLSYCKFRSFGVQVFGYISFTCMCLATIDQFLATCAGVYWRQWNNIRLTQRLCAGLSVVWILYCIPYLVLYDHVLTAGGASVTCTNTNLFFRQYHAYMNNIVLSSSLPILITVVFASLAYKNVRLIAYRAVPLVRRELDKQLTNMVLVQVVWNVFTLTPYAVATVLPLATTLNNYPNTSAQLSFALNVTASVYYLYYGVSIK